ncbi:MAG: hypothetical protein KAU22_01635, partial [Desulfuromonadales bacterium]|nr:hypothetical protein [Desulfuromonadales bacterium]
VEFAQNPIIDNDKLALSFLRQGQREFPDDLGIRLALLSLELENSRPIPNYKQMDKLSKLIEQAKTTADHKIGQRAEQLSEHYKRMIAWHHDCANLEDQYDDNDCDENCEEEFDNEVLDDFFDSLAESLPPGASKPPKNWPRRRTRK